MGKKLGLDKSYNALKTTLGKYPIVGGTPTSTFMKRSLKLRAGNVSGKSSSLFKERRLKLRAGNVSGKSSSLFKERALKLRAGQPLTTSVNKGSKLLNIGKKVFGRTPIGRAVNLAVNVGSGIGIGYGIAKNKFKGKSETKVDKKSAGGEMNQMNIKGYMGGGASRGYGAARTSGMGLQDESLMPGKMVRAKNGKMLSAKQKKIARMAPPPDKITGADFKAMKAKNGKMVKK